METYLYIQTTVKHKMTQIAKPPDASVNSVSQ